MKRSLALTKADKDRLNAAAKFATEAGESISLNLTRLINELEVEVPAAFRGSAANSFQNVTAELSQELKKILDALNEMADKVNISGQVFGSTDADAAREISSVGSSYLPGAGNVTTALRG